MAITGPAPFFHSENGIFKPVHIVIDLSGQKISGDCLPACPRRF
jgi:hypothetical protein